MRSATIRRREIDWETYAFAESLRAALGADTIPVNMERVAFRVGVRMECRTLPSGVRGVSDVAARVIVLNSRRSARARRFDFLHEVAEILTLELGNRHDHWQNEFAAHLLVPMGDLALNSPPLIPPQDVGGDLIRGLAERYEASESVILGQMAMLESWGMRWHR